MMVKAQKAAVGPSEGGCVGGSSRRSIGVLHDDGSSGPWILISSIGAMCFAAAAWAFTFPLELEPYMVSWNVGLAHLAKRADGGSLVGRVIFTCPHASIGAVMLWSQGLGTFVLSADDA